MWNSFQLTRKADKNKVDTGYECENPELRSVKDVKNYCKAHNILFKPDLVDFSYKNKCQGKINSVSDFDSPPSPSQPSISAIVKRDL